MIDVDVDELYRAYSHCYGREARTRRYTFMIDLGFAAAALVATLANATDRYPDLAETLTTWLPLAALFWLTLREIDVIPVDQTHRRSAVSIQEQLDLVNWKGRDWKDQWNRLLAGEPVGRRTIKEFAVANTGASMPVGYWVDTAGLADNDAALFRIQQTAAWGAKGHGRYAKLNTGLGLAGLVVVVAIAMLLDVSARESGTATIAVAPFLVGRIQSGRAHADRSASRVTLEQHIDAVLDPQQPSRPADVRAAQDELYRLRMDARRIPSWLYNRYADHDRAVIDATVAADVEAFRARMR